MAEAMADESGEVEDELPRCSTLFLSEDGSQMLFYMTPCAMKTRLRPLIHDGGGHLSSKVLPDSIKLAAPGTGSGILPGYVSTDYIFDSIKHNKLQDLKNYRITSPDSSVKSSSPDSSVKSSSPDSNVKSSKNKIKARKQNGRSAYTLEEDLALMDFVNKNFTCYTIGGNLLYKKAEKEKVTSHTWQSMRDHYLKHLHKQRNDKALSPQSFWTRTGNGEKGRENKKDDKTSNLERATITRAQASRLKKELKSENRKTVTLHTEQIRRFTRSWASKVKQITASKRKDEETDEQDDETDKNVEETGEEDAVTDERDEGTDDKDNVTDEKDEITDEKHEEIDEKDDVTDDKSAANLPDVGTVEESSPAEDVDYDKLFDDNLLKLAHERKQRAKVRYVSDSTDDEDTDEENRVSSSQETNKSVTPRRQKMLTNEQDKMSDFDGEVVFKKNLKSPSARKVLSDDEDDKRPLPKRSKTDVESSPDHGNHSGDKETKEMETFLHFYQVVRSNIEKLQSELTVPQIIHTLLVNSGDFSDAENYLKTGKEQWTPKEDKILLSKNQESISSLAQKRGLQAVVDRINFMEGIN